MGEPEFVDGYFMSDSDLTDYERQISDAEPFYGVCPVCGSEITKCIGESLEDFDSTIIRFHHCTKCNSDFSFTYWVKAIVIDKDGRFKG